MPNWCFNELDINSSLINLVNDKWLIKTWEEYWVSSFIFNLHKLYPEKYPKEYKTWKYMNQDIPWQYHWKVDNTFEKYWDYNWCVSNIGTKWVPTLETICNDNENAYFTFESARWPPDEMLKTFWKLSWIWFQLYYEEEWNWFEWDLEFDWKEIIKDETRDYIHRCSDCEEKQEDVKYIDEIWEYLCDGCRIKSWYLEPEE